MIATIEHRQTQLDQIFNWYAGDNPIVNDVDIKSDRCEWTLEDKDLCAIIAGSQQGDKFQTLFAGRLDGYGSQSEADLALCNILAFWTAKDSKRMDRIFRKSELFRAKWDEMHGLLPYGVMTIQRAIDGTENVYQAKTSSTEKIDKGTNRFKLLTDGDLAALPPMQWRIKGVLPECGLGVLFGPSGSGKSFIALDIAQSVAVGGDWFGHKVKPCNVIYAALEGEGGIAGRMAAYRLKHGKTAQNIHYLIQPFNLLKSEDVLELAIEIQAIGGAGLVILDTLNRAAPGADENGSKDMSDIISASKNLQALVGGLVLPVHHTGKDASKGLRGHSSLHAALDAAIEVKRNGDNSREWIIAKSKDGKDGASFPFRLEVVQMGIDEEGDEITSCVIEKTEVTKSQYVKPLTDAQNLGLNAYCEAAKQDGLLDDEGNFAGLHLEAWRTRFYTLSTGDTQDAKKKAFQRARNDLVKLGKLTVSNDIYRLQGLLSETFEADFAKQLKATGTRDTDRTEAGQVPALR